MRRRPLPARLPAPAAAIGAALLLSACSYVGNPAVGFGGFLGDVHTFNRNPNLPPGSDENARYSEGRPSASSALLPEGGNIWPGPPPPIPTLTDVEKEQNQGLPPDFQAPSPVPGSPNYVPPKFPKGSSTPPEPLPAPGAPSAGLPPAQFPPVGPQPGGGQPPVLNTPGGPLINNGPVGVPGGASSAGSPNGGTSIIVPNGNGTSTVIAPDGSTTTIPTPR